MPLDLDALGISPPGPGADPEAPEVALHWLVTMAALTEQAAPPEAPAVATRAVEQAQAKRPDRDVTLGQLHIDAASSARRAAAILEATGPDAAVIAIGDDDGVTVALRALGATDVHAVDLDPRLLAWLGAHGVETTLADVLGSSVPEPLRRRFDAAVTDPFRDLDGGLGFLTYAAACVRPGGDLFWVDHPAWNYEHHVVRDALASLGWRVTEERPSLHRYPLAPGELEPVAAAYPEHAAEIRALAARCAAWSDLYRLRRT